MTIPYLNFYCRVCDRITPVDPTDPDTAVCDICNEPYQCGDCGFEIDRRGNCLRPGGHDTTEEA